jgi:hypothetical protein
MYVELSANDRYCDAQQLLQTTLAITLAQLLEERAKISQNNFN